MSCFYGVYLIFTIQYKQYIINNYHKDSFIKRMKLVSLQIKKKISDFLSTFYKKNLEYV